MSDEPQSPRRRHILASINVDAPRKHNDGENLIPSSPRCKAPSPSRRDEKSREINEDDEQPRPSRLRLKSHRRRRSRDRHEDDSSHQSSRRPRHHRSHRHRRRHRSPTPPNPHEEPPLDPDVAFRESLFDAMADDEGAAYWEGVYGQPVHVYSNDRVGPTGKLEQMTDEEYTAYVREKMWEKTHAGVLEERAKRAERKKRKEQEERHSRKLYEEMERCLRQGEERQQRKRRAERWDEYTQAWAAWDGTVKTLAWPLDKGEREDINEPDVRAFFVHGLGLEDLGESAFVAKLKEERVRWHPDKIQQKLGGKVDADVMKDVTFIFQIIDRLWGDVRGKG